MPVQINEMIIRATIVEPGEKAKSKESNAAASPAGNKADIVKECVEQVLQILQNKNQR